MAQEFDTPEDDTVYMIITPRKMRKWDFMAIGLQGLSAIHGVVSDVLRDSAGVLLRHSQFEQMQAAIHEDMAYEMETLVAEVEGTEE